MLVGIFLMGVMFFAQPALMKTGEYGRKVVMQILRSIMNQFLTGMGYVID